MSEVDTLYKPYDLSPGDNVMHRKEIHGSSSVLFWIRDYLYIGMGHYVQTLEPYWALPFWIIKRSRENMLLLIWIIMRTHDLIYILIYILMKWLPIDFPHCNIKMFLFFYFFLRMAWDSNLVSITFNCLKVDIWWDYTFRECL